MNKLWNFMDAKKTVVWNIIHMKRIYLFVFLILFSMCGFSQEFEKPFRIIDQEIIDKYKNLYKDRETGDNYDPATGTVTFAVTDIAIPGNSSLPVALSRWIPSDDLKTFPLGGGWYWDIPVIKANYMDINPHISTGGSGSIDLSQDGWYGGKNCSQTFSQQVFVSNHHFTHFVESWFYWEGKQLHIPGKTTEKFLEANETTPFVSNVQVTKSNYKVIECIQLENNQEGFVVKGPDGTTYTFGKVKSYYTGAEPPTSNSPLTKFTRLIMVTEIKDRFGNTVNYEYNGPEGALSAIVGSDNRRIDITYKAYSYKSILYYIPDFSEANGKRWTYGYSNYVPDFNFPTETRKVLTTVTLPDDSSWSYSSNLELLGFDPVKGYQVSNYRPDTGENIPGLCQARTASDINAVVTSPEGLTTEYKFKLTYHGRSKVVPDTQMMSHISNVPHFEYDMVSHISYARNLNCSINYSLKEKKITGTGVIPKIWKYDYSENTGTYVIENPIWVGPGLVINGSNLNQFQTGSRSPVFLSGMPANIIDAEDFRTTTVTGPDSKKIYYIDRRFLSPTEGGIAAEDNLNIANNALLQRTETIFTKANYVGRHWFYKFSPEGPSINSINSNLIQYRVNKAQQKTSFYYADGTDTYTITYDDYDSLGFFGKLSEDNNFSSFRRYTKNGYIHDQSRWILGLPTTTQISADDASYTTVNELVYHSSSNTGLYTGLYLPYEYKSYGTWIRRYPEFKTTGQVSRILYNQLRLNASGGIVANSYRNQVFDLYKRGKAQLISTPLRYSSYSMAFSRSINDDGWVTSITDLNGVTAEYDYDLVGRLKSVNLPESWLDTSIEWQEPVSGPIKRIGRSCKLNVDKSGCESGSITLESTSEYDALYRILKSGDNDLNNNKSRYQNVAYNSVHQPTFTSFKSESAAEIQGTTNTYDNLGRLTSVSLSNGGTVTHQYLSGNKIKVTDAEDNETITTYLAYGLQDYSKALTINAPEGITTSHVINVFGDLTSTTQTGPGKDGSGTLSLTEYRAYDAMHYLCKVSRSDVGTTVLGNNLLGEVQWKAQGVSGGTVTDCVSNANANNKIYFTYDNQGDLWKVNHPDADLVPAPDLIYTRDKNGNIKTIQAGSIIQTYNYNILGLLEDEALQVNGKNFKLDYGYNPAGHLAYLTYPDGAKVNFNPNAFGEAQSVTRNAIGAEDPFTYVEDVNYYPNGYVDSFAYGNGLSHKTTLNSRRLPESVSDYRAGFNALHYGYTYDDNSRITSLTDYIDNNFSIANFVYDGAGRLKSTTGNSGVGSSNMRYDGLDNITYYHNKKHTLDYTYDVNNRLQSVASSGIESKPYDLFTYDDRGNITHNSYHDFIYNRANQLVESGDNHYIYDAYNRRVVTQAGEKTTYSFYSQTGKLYYTETIDGGINYIYLGSRLVAKDGVIPENGNKQHYLPFGASVEGEINDVGYTGHKFDKDIGLSYMQARYYDPVLGRFMSPDPIGSADQFNLFAYVGNDPINNNDPTGRFGAGFEQGFKGGGQYLKQFSTVLSKERLVATVVGEAAKASAGLDAMSTAADSITVVAIGFAQPEIAAATTAISTAASVGGNAIEHKANDYALAELSGQAAGTAAGNVVEAAVGAVDKITIEEVIDKTLKSAGSRGKVINAIKDVASEMASQQASEAASDGYLDQTMKTKPFTN